MGNIEVDIPRLSREEIFEFASWIASTLSNTYNNIYYVFYPVDGRQQTKPETNLTQNETIKINTIPNIDEIVIDFESIASPIAGLTSPIDQLKSWLAEKISAFIDAVKSVMSAIIDTIVSKARDFLASMISAISDKLSRIGETILGYIKDAIRRVIDTLKTVIIEPLMKVYERAKEFLSSFLGMISNAIDRVRSFIAEIPEKISSVIRTVSDTLSGIISRVRDVISSVIDSARRAFSTLISSIKNAISTFIDYVKTAISKVGDVIATIRDKITDVFAMVYEKVTSFLGKIVETVKAIPDYISKIPETMKTVIVTVANRIWEHIVKPSYEWIRDHIFTPLIDRFKDFYEKASNAVLRVGSALTGFMNAILKFPEWFKEYIVKPLTAIWDALKRIPEILGEAWGTIKNAILNFKEWVKEHVVTPTMEAIVGSLKWVGEKILAFAGWIVDKVEWLGGVIWKGMVKAGEWVVKALGGFIEFVKTIPSRIADFLTKIVAKFFTSIVDPMRSYLKENIPLLIQGKKGEISVFTGLVISIVPSYLVVMLLPTLLKGLARMFKGQRIVIGIPRTSVELTFSLPAILYSLGERLEKVPDAFMEALLTGWALVTLEPLRYVFRAGWKRFLTTLKMGNVPFEIPSFEASIKLLRRYGIEENVDYLRDILYYRGYPDWFVKYALATVGEKEPKAVIVVKDRFNVDRKFPLSLLYEMPSVSDLCTFMIRDMFSKGTDFIDLMEKVGVYRDVALFYYLLHYRYPSPEKIWEFTTRAIAGVLWNPDKTIDQVAVQIFKLENIAKNVKAPVELNYDAETVFEMLKTYMKWHDYARFPWKSGWATDNAIIVDLLADIPGKIDVRWMTRWGLFEVFAREGITIESSLKDIVETFKSKTVSKGEIVMDLQQLCRMLQARGYHPDWVPFMAVAEAMNSLTEERTLLRTGFMNLYKYGFWTYKDLEELMSGFFKVYFDVAHFDMNKKEWTTFTFEMPVMFLPPERRLLELRAVFDRAVDLLRDYMRLIERGVRRLIISTKEASDKIKKFIMETINPWFKDEVKQITGEERALTVDESWLKIFLEYSKQLQDVETIERARTYARYLIWRLLYRYSRGFISKKELEETIDEIVKLIREAESVKQLILLVAEQEYDSYIRSIKANAIISKFSRGIITMNEAMEQLEKLGLAKDVAEAFLESRTRYYTPTPSMLATISEVVPEAIGKIEEVFRTHFVPESWKPIWRKYIEVKPLLSEIREYISACKRMFQRFEIDKSKFEELLQTIKEYGWTDKEIKFIIKSNELLRGHYAYQYLVGTPRELVTMAEYSPSARQLALERVKAMIDALPVDPKTKELIKAMWEEYIRVRPIYDEVRRFCSELVRAYSEGVISKLQLENTLRQLKKYGLDDYEIKFWMEIAELRLKIEEAYRMRGG